MSLPVLETPRYELELLSKKSKVKFRPFLVKEQKVLMTALTTGEKKDVRMALLECAKACTFGEVDVARLPIFDLERLFLYIRAKSVGEELPLRLKCENEECGEFNAYDLNLIDQMQIANLDKVTDKVELADGYGFVIAYPNAEILAVASEKAKDQNDLQFYIELTKSCLLGVYKGEDYFTVDPSDPAASADVERVLDALNSEQMAKVQAFFDDMPKVAYSIEFTCTKCSHVNKLELEGTDSFFG